MVFWGGDWLHAASEVGIQVQIKTERIERSFKEKDACNLQ